MKTTHFISRVTILGAALAVCATAASLARSENAVVRANSEFSFDLYAQLAKENPGGNLFFSPYSISSALAMTAEGARGETAEQMGQVLRYPKPARAAGENARMNPWEMSTIHKEMSALNQRFNGKKDSANAHALRQHIAELEEDLSRLKSEARESPTQSDFKLWGDLSNPMTLVSEELNELRKQINQYELKVANALYGEKTHPFKKDYLETISQHYKTGGVFPVDFMGNYENVRLRINGWVEDQTNARRPDGAVFDGMSHAKSPERKLYISKVLHKAFVEVNEKGTEAAAATAVVDMSFGAAAAPVSVPFTPIFKADRPFIYMIRDRATGSILFLGRMMEPVSK